MTTAGTHEASTWRPLRIHVFRDLLVANLISDIGTFMQNVGAAWMMVSFGVGPSYVALTQTATALPFFLFAPIAGSIGDVVDRRRLVILAQTWMVLAALAIAALTIVGRMTPWALLVLTFALSAGDAFETPSWRAILPELVGKDDLAGASILNGIEFNLARSVGPALAGVVIAAAGVAAVFITNALSFIGVLAVIARWKRPATVRTAPPEKLSGALVAGIRYMRFSPMIRAVTFRQGVTMLFASALLALLPSLACSVSTSALGYGILLGAFGAGAIVGALVMPFLRSRWSIEAVVVSGVIAVGIAMIVAGTLHSLLPLAAVMLLAGTAWICFVSLTSTLIQTSTADWVRARVLALYLLTFQGSVAAGSAFWGAVGQRAGIPVALHWSGLGVLISVSLALKFKLPNMDSDTSPWVHWRLPVVGELDMCSGAGPVLVLIEYQVLSDRRKEFVGLMKSYSRSRRRNGASRWELFKDVEETERYLEVFLVQSWAEHLRQHQRQTHADGVLEGKVRDCVAGNPEVRHLLYE